MGKIRKFAKPDRICPEYEYSQRRSVPAMQPGVAEFLKLGKQALGLKHLDVYDAGYIDNFIQKLVDGGGEDVDIPFGQALYTAFCAAIAMVKADASATAELLVLRLREAEGRIAELEAAPKLEYAGVYVSSRRYVKGQFVTYAGSLWHCNAPTGGESGFDKTRWTLAVKRGVDAKPVLTVAA